MENQNAGPGWDEAASHTLISLCRSGQASLHTLGKGGLWPAAKPRADHPARDVDDLFRASEVILEDGAVCFKFIEAGRTVEQRSKPQGSMKNSWCEPHHPAF
jgi:hypothetical protein